MKNAPATSQSNESAKTEKPHYTTSCPETHPAWVRVQRILESQRNRPDTYTGGVYGVSVIPAKRDPYDPSQPLGALLKSVLIFIIKAGGQVDRASTIRELAKQTGFTPANVRGVLDWLIRAKVARQIATAESTIEIRLVDGAEVADHAD